LDTSKEHSTTLSFYMQKQGIFDKGGRQQKWEKGKEKLFFMFLINLQNWPVQQAIQDKPF